MGEGDQHVNITGNGSKAMLAPITEKTCRHSRSMHLYQNGMPLPLVAAWLGHARMDTTRKFFANADTTMKKEAILTKQHPI